MYLLGGTVGVWGAVAVPRALVAANGIVLVFHHCGCACGCVCGDGCVCGCDYCDIYRLEYKTIFVLPAWRNVFEVPLTKCRDLRKT